jgi:hypothetical protein
MHTIPFDIPASGALCSTMLPSVNHLSGLISFRLTQNVNWTAALTLHYSSQASKAKREVIFKRAESYVKEYLSKEKEEIRLKRAARAAGDFYVPAQPKVYFVIRIRG